MSSISAGTSTGTALVSTGDTTGALVFKTGASATTAMTIGADQSVVFAGTVSGGLPGSGGATASGSVTLTSTSAGAQSITPTAYGQIVTLPNATTLGKSACVYNINNLGGFPLKIVNASGSILGFAFPYSSVSIGLADNSTSAGTWILSGAEQISVTANNYITGITISNVRSVVAIDTNRKFFLLAGLTSLYGIIYNSATQTWGTATLIRSTGFQGIAILSAADQILVNSCATSSTTFEAVVLTLSGNSITVGTATTSTNSANMSGAFINLVAVGTSWIVSYSGVINNRIRAMTISGTTVTIGSETIISGTAQTYVYTTAVSSSVLLSVSLTTNSTLFATPYTISGTTITIGTQASVAVSSTASYFRILPISNGARWVMVYQNSTATGMGASIISVSSTTASLSTVTICSAISISDSLNDMIVSGSKLFYIDPGQASNSCKANILVDTSGTASVGTEVAAQRGTTVGGAIVGSVDSNIVTVYSAIGPNLVKGNYDISGTSATVSSIDSILTADTTSTYALSYFGYSAWNGVRNGGNLYGTMNFSINTSVTATCYLAMNKSSFYSYPGKFRPAKDGVTTFPNLNLNEAWGLTSNPASIAATTALLTRYESIT